MSVLFAFQTIADDMTYSYIGVPGLLLRQGLRESGAHLTHMAIFEGYGMTQSTQATPLGLGCARNSQTTQLWLSHSFPHTDAPKRTIV